MDPIVCTEDKIYCIQVAENEEIIRQHARRAKFPINLVAEVRSVIDPLTGDPNKK